MATNIEWTDETWNPITGCHKVSQGCKNCWSKALHDMRHKAHLSGKKMPAQYAEPFEVVKCHLDRLQIPLHWRHGRMCFSPSGADPFHEDVGQTFLDHFFVVIALTRHVTYQVLTKRADRMVEYFHGLRDDGVRARRWSQIACELSDSPYAAGLIEDLPWPLPNLWPGVSVENRDALPRLDALRMTPAAVPMVSFGPLLEDLGQINLQGIGWAIVEGETGKDARPMHPGWVRSLRDQCVQAGVPFFFKQWGQWGNYQERGHPRDRQLEMACFKSDGTYLGAGGGGRGMLEPNWRENGGAYMLRVGKKEAGRILDGREWNEFPKPYPGHQVVRLKKQLPVLSSQLPVQTEEVSA